MFPLRFFPARMFPARFFPEAATASGATGFTSFIYFRRASDRAMLRFGVV